MNQTDISRRTFLKTSALAVPLLAAGCASLGASPRAGDFVSVRQGQFYLRGKPHYYVGANLWFCCYLSDAALPDGRARMVRELDFLKSLGITNVRLLAGSETSPLVGAIPRGITKAPHEYDEALLAGLDFCLAEMAKRDMRGILFVSNYWQWSGSFAEYVRWVTGATIPDPDLPVMRAIGVREITAFLAGEIDAETAIAAGQQATRNYAKRQYTWLRHQTPPEWPRIAYENFIDKDDIAGLFQI